MKNLGHKHLGIDTKAYKGEDSPSKKNMESEINLSVSL